MISEDKITEIFCSIDDFCLAFDPTLRKRQEIGDLKCQPVRS